MTLTVLKVRGANNVVRFSFQDGQKNVTWEVNSDDDDAVIVGVLQDIVNVVRPHVPHDDIPLGYNTHWIGAFGEALPVPADIASVAANQGLRDAEKAAQEEEMRLKNMGSALRTGLNMGPEDIPVFDNGELPPVNWSQ